MAAFLQSADGSRVDVRDGLTIGRVAACDLVIHDAKASRKHACIHSAGGVVELEDLGSSNGTLLNGKPVTRRMLRDGDVIRIGTTEITFREQAGAAAAPAAGHAPLDDLFGEDGAEAVVDRAPPPAPVVSRLEPRPAVAEQLAPAVELRRAAPPTDAEEELLEFADEDVVRVKRLVPKAAKPAAPVRDSGVLQFHKIEDRHGLIAQDLGQMSGLARLGLYLLALAVAAALFYGAMRAVS